MRADGYYTPEDVVELIERANALGLDISEGCDLEKLTLEQFEILVTRKQ